jgi:glyoxylase-like metal-dependent hydrolase (beta-lactamase superfamily II)
LTSVSWLLTFALCPLPFALTGVQTQYTVHAVRFATLPAFRVSSLVAGADRSRTLDIAMMVWVVRGAGRTILVDAGFYRDKFITQWKPAPYSRPSDALASGLDIRPDDVTDIIVSHIHWDHADGIDLFPKATVWIQREEYAHYVGAGGAVKAGGIDADVAAMLFALHGAGRVRLVDGDDQTIAPGVRLYTGGRHTFASQYAGVTTRSGVVILASDNAYLYENLDNRIPIAQTLDAPANLAAQARMLALAAPRLVIPGHDPAVFERFPPVRPGVVRIDEE